ncbi:nitrate/nitrite transporter [Deinococcus altitudinis]|uniref:MFS transporter n=1 Tax=Deinococcus altitudinis TaxID=468914 RepID=UPI0038918F14
MTARPSTQDVQDAGRWRALTLLALAVVCCMSPWFSAAAVLPQLRALWGWSSAQGASLTLAVQLGFVAGAVLSAFGGLPDRFPHRRLMLLGGVLAGAANLGLLAARPELTLVLRALTGAALALVYPVSLKAMSGWFVRGRGLALGVIIGALTLGSALPHLVNGLNRGGAGGLDWRAVIVTTSLLAALGGMLAALVPAGPHRFPAVVFRPAGALRALSGRKLRLTTLGYLGHMWELYACWAWFAAFFAGVLTRAGDTIPLRGAALATFAVVGVGALGCVAGGLLADRLGRARLTRAAMLLSGGCALSLALVSGWQRAGGPVWPVLAVSLVWGASIIADSAQFSALTSEVADPRYVGTALTLQLALGFTLTALSIALVPVVAAHWGWSVVFLLLAPGPLLGAWAMGRLQQR